MARSINSILRQIGMNHSGIRKLTVQASLSSLFVLPLCAQYIPRSERGNSVERLKSDIGANNLLTTIFNFGFSGRTGVGQGIPYEWPRGTGRDYIALSSLFVGGEVYQTPNDTLHIVDLANYRSNPADGSSWNFEPVPGYRNPASFSIARSDDPSTWPPFWPDKQNDPADPGWPGSWNGLLGKNKVINGTEMYFHYADNLYSRYSYAPDTTDMSRGGLGLVISERVLEWKDFILNDDMVEVYDIYNAGTKDIPKAAVTFWIADLVGGDGDSQDDQPSYDLTKRTIYFNDLDGLSSNPAYANATVGLPAYVFLKTPMDLGISNVQYLQAGGINFNTTADIYYWQKMMAPGSFNLPDVKSVPGDYDLFASCGRFPLQAGTSTRIVTGWIFSNNKSEADRKAKYLKSFVNGGFSAQSIPITVLAPTPGSVVSGAAPILWNANNNDPQLNADVYISSDAGDSWNILAENQPNTGSYQFDPNALADGIFYKVQIVAFSDSGIGYSVSDSLFTINTQKSAPVQIRLDKSIVGRSLESSVSIKWLGGCADGGISAVSLSYKTNASPWTAIAAGLPASGNFDWDTPSFPNSSSYTLRATIANGSSTAMDSSGIFSVCNARYRVMDSGFVQRNTVGTGLIEPHVVDSTALTGHPYDVWFSVSPESVTTYNVFDTYVSRTVLSNVTQISGDVEGPEFDGIRLLVKNDPVQPDTARSKWNRGSVYKAHIQLFSNGFSMGLPSSNDLVLVMGADGLDTSRTTVGPYTLPARAVNFTVLDRLTGARQPFGYYEPDGTDGHFSSSVSNGSDIIFLLTSDGRGSFVPSWTITLSNSSPGVNPQQGDSLWINFDRPFQTFDTYRFVGVKGGEILGVQESHSLTFDLSRNFPNPFNPSTTIRFSIPTRSFVRLTIYNLLGQRVAELVNEELNAGYGERIWNANAASGLYFYRLEAVSVSDPNRHFVDVKKMLLLK